MLRTIMVGLDGTNHSKSALELGIRLAKRFEAMVVGLTVVDEPLVTEVEATPMGAVFSADLNNEDLLRASRRKTDQWLEAFSLSCADAGVSSKVLQEVGDPVDIFQTQAQRFDIVLLGQTTHFRYANQDSPCETLAQYLHQPPRPVIAVPENPPSGDSIVIAYDGSPGSARTAAAFLESGLGADKQIHILTLHHDHKEGSKIAGHAVEYLHAHGLKVQPHVISDHDVKDTVFEQLSELNAELLVMGAFGHSAVHEHFFGSTTRKVLKGTWVPVFLYH